MFSWNIVPLLIYKPFENIPKMKLKFAFLFALSAGFTFATFPPKNVIISERAFLNIKQNLESLFKNNSLDVEMNLFTSFVSVSNASLRNSVRQLIPRTHNVSLNNFTELEAKLLDGYERTQVRMNELLIFSFDTENDDSHSHDDWNKIKPFALILAVWFLMHYMMDPNVWRCTFNNP